jgi:hypothetical protein
VGVVVVLAGRDLRRRWWSLAVLVVLVGVIGGLVLASAAGARRTASSLDRFRRESAAADVELLGDPSPHQIKALGEVPGVEAIGLLRGYGLVLPQDPALQAIRAPVGLAFGRSVDRPRLMAGRAPSSSAEEIALDEALATLLHLRVGDTLDTSSYSPDQVAAILGGDPDVGPLAGPQVRLRVVGIERRPLDLADRGVSGGLLILGPGFDAKYADRIGVFGVSLRVRISDQTDAATVTAQARKILGDHLFATQGLSVETAGARDAIHVLAVAIWIFAAVAAAAGAVAIAFVLSRDLFHHQRDQDTYGALGLTRLQRFGIVAARGAVAAVGGSALALVGAVLASPRFPFGLARRAEPNPGLHLDVLALGIGVVGFAFVVLAIVAIAGFRATARASQLGSPARAPRPSRTLSAAARLGLSPPATNGVRMALDRRSDEGPVPVQSTVVGVALAVTGTIVVLLLATNVHLLASSPTRYGWTWDVAVADTSDNRLCGAQQPDLASVTALSAVDEVCSQTVDVDGRSVGGLAFTALRGPRIDPTVLEGRAPRGDHEVGLGTATLRALHKHVGESVTVQRRGDPLRYQVVGRVVLPSLGDAQPLADGAVFTGEGFAPLFDFNIFTRYFVGRVATGGDRQRLEHQVAALSDVAAPVGPTLPGEVSRLQQTGWLAPVLIALFALLGLGAAAHALVTNAVRRRSDFATLRVLGFTPRQVRSTVACQTTTIAFVGLAIGVPLGIIAGKAGWRLLAGALGASDTTSLPMLPFVLTAAVTLLAMNVAGLRLGRRPDRPTTAAGGST